MKKKNKAFILSELLLALFIFAIVMGVFANTLSFYLKSQRYILSSQTLVQELSYSLERMSRIIRMSEVPPDSNQNGATSTLLLSHSVLGEVKYLLNGNKIYEKIGDASSTPLTSDKVKVEKLKFYLQGVGNDTPYNLQPKITISILAKPNIASQKREIKLQTTVSLRALEIY